MSTLSEEESQRVESWLAPLSASAPAGVNARGEPDFERVTQEMSKLDAMTGR